MATMPNPDPGSRFDAYQRINFFTHRRDGLSNMRPEIVALLYGLMGLVFIAIGIPLALESVPPNHWYGFRTAKTLSNQAIWYAANRVTGIDLIIAGVVIALGMLAMFILHETVMPALPIAFWPVPCGDDGCRVSRLLVLEPGLAAKMPRAASRSIHACGGGGET
jgi:hypothetical protein